MVPAALPGSVLLGPLLRLVGAVVFGAGAAPIADATGPTEAARPDAAAAGVRTRDRSRAPRAAAS